ncbi:hypothetical protein [Okeania sp. SIO1I7]|uniref:hypothetical protein n=1 Tax=Okeania sp. SIO1I7 TaxID=2607772 RepID=UPI0013F937AD|nr:hypothetical protein [Okeania sp. SIO1I7]NET28805.1 hypothetical protein [Okeania sp. SIO1I7]
MALTIRSLLKVNDNLSKNAEKTPSFGVAEGLRADHPHFVGGLGVDAICSRAKLISQIIAYIWLNIEKPETLAKEAIKWFKDPTLCAEGEGLSHFSKLMIAIPGDSDNYSKFLKEVFPDLTSGGPNQKFPLFNPQDVENGKFLFKTDPSIYEGHIQDPDLYSDGRVKVVIAFPPCPKLGLLTVTEDELREWVENRNDDIFLPPSPYCPTCCC